MKGLVLFLLVLVVIGSLSFAAISIVNNKSEIKQKQENKILEFSAFTSAVCENKEKFVYCKDEVFVKCNGKISKAADVEVCNGLKIGIPKANGFSTFGNDWKDPRN